LKQKIENRKQANEKWGVMSDKWEMERRKRELGSFEIWRDYL
jgi:hypothetical protein